MSNWSGRVVAEQWKQAAVERNRHLAAVTEAMFTLAHIAPGMRVLDVGTGAGDVALLAAERVGPGGTVVATDFSEEMVISAADSVREAGATNVTVRKMNVEAIDLPDASFDAALARMVLMFVEDLRGTLAGVARVLAPNGRLAAATWSALANNPFHAAIVDVARQMGPLPTPPSEVVRAFGLSDPRRLVEAARGAGFVDVEVRVVAGERRIPSIPDQIATQRSSPLVAGLFASVDDAARERAWAEVERRWRSFEVADGAAVFPSEMLVFGATVDPSAHS